MGEVAPGPDRFAVLAVCTGNIGRSPIMERVLLDRLRAHGVSADVQVRSAGTHAVTGAGMEDGARLALLELGISPEGFGATPLEPRLAETADLVVVATREHRAEVVGLAPRAVRRTFTLHELARIAATCPAMPAPVPGSGPGRMRAAVAWAAQLRGSVPRPDLPSHDDLEDALGEPLDVYRSRAAEVVASVERIVPYLLGDDHAG